MRVCMILEGCYPYTRGGVSSWVNDYIKSSPDTEYVLWTIHAKRSDAQKMMYRLPENVVEFKKVFLEDAYLECEKKESEEIYAILLDSLNAFLFGGNYSDAIKNCRERAFSPSEIAHSNAFLDFAVRVSEKTGTLGLAEAFYGLRSILLPVIYLLNQDIPNADIYHSAVAGYGGLLGAVAKTVTGKPFILSEHGLYPREREEELLINDWLSDGLRDIWIEFFYNLSRSAYDSADKVTALFEDAIMRQRAIGCDKEKCSFVHNGIYVERFSDIPDREDDGYINIGAFIRFAPIKDIKTLIYVFNNLKNSMENTRLYIFGGTDDKAYKKECLEIIKELRLCDVYILGFVDTVEYMKQLDLTIMTSISEGQPLAILESLAAGRPCVVTNVGSCKEIVEGKNPNEKAGICCSPMDVEGITQALKNLCQNKELRKQYGENGRKIIAENYTHELMMKKYFKVYQEVL